MVCNKILPNYFNSDIIFFAWSDNHKETRNKTIMYQKIRQKNSENRKEIIQIIVKLASSGTMQACSLAREKSGNNVF